MMATGGLLVTANAGSMAPKSWGISGRTRRSRWLHLAERDRQPSGGSRIFWGWGVGQDRPRAGDGDRVRAAGGSPGAGADRRAAVGHAVRGNAGWRPSSRGRGASAVSVALVADYFGTACATANYGVMYSAKGVSSIIAGGIAAMTVQNKFGSWTACFYGHAAPLALGASIIVFGLCARRVRPRSAMGIPAAAK